MKLARALPIGLFVVATLAMADPYEDGITAYDRGDYATSLRLWLPLAEQGHRTAAFNVGVLYEKGLGTAQDYREAARWYLKAAEAGELEAAYDVALFYETGTGLPRDLGQARHWYLRIIASPQHDAGSEAIKERARTRVANLPSDPQEVVTYDGGRFVVVHRADRQCVVALQGLITGGTARTFDEVIDRTKTLGCDTPWLMLESPGGLLNDGLDVGREVHARNLRTITRYECASACALIFLAGRERVLVGSRARIGFHQVASVYRNDRKDRHCSAMFDSNGVRETKRYLAAVIPDRSDALIRLVMATSCDAIDWVSGQRAIDLGVATGVEDDGVDVFGSKARR